MSDDGEMGLDVNRWLTYAKARVSSAVSQGNASLDRLEAEREAEQADRPWLRSESPAPSLDEARARIRCESEQQGTSAGDAPAGGDPSQPPPPTPASDPALRAPEAVAADAEREAARLELVRRQQASTERLRAIRSELGIDDPPSSGDPSPPAPPKE